MGVFQRKLLVVLIVHVHPQVADAGFAGFETVAVWFELQAQVWLYVQTIVVVYPTHFFVVLIFDSSLELADIVR
ncbi:hypothetical protein D3C80_528090 [compost metagenome]